MPREWVLANIETLAQPLLTDADRTGNDWAWRRLLEVCDFLDEGLTQRLSLRAIASEHGEIRKAGWDYLEM
jgi:hypothetical protein